MILRNDGTVVYKGNDKDIENTVGGWNNILKIAAGCSHVAALNAEGRVCAAGDNDKGQCAVGEWNEVEELFADGYKTILIGAIKENIGSNRVIEKCGFMFEKSIDERMSYCKPEIVTKNYYRIDR